MDEYRKNWTFRYLREAETDLFVGEKHPISSMGVNFLILAMRKMQTAIYYCLGDPSYLTKLVETALRHEVRDRSLLRFLVQFDRLIQERTAIASVSSKEDTLNEANQLMKMTTEIVTIIFKDETN
jgi:hypothetical protein